MPMCSCPRPPCSSMSAEHSGDSSGRGHLMVVRPGLWSGGIAGSVVPCRAHPAVQGSGGGGGRQERRGRFRTQIVRHIDDSVHRFPRVGETWEQFLRAALDAGSPLFGRIEWDKRTSSPPAGGSHGPNRPDPAVPGAVRPTAGTACRPDGSRERRRSPDGCPRFSCPATGDSCGWPAPCGGQSQPSQCGVGPRAPGFFDLRPGGSEVKRSLPPVDEPRTAAG